MQVFYDKFYKLYIGNEVSKNDGCGKTKQK